MSKFQKFILRKVEVKDYCTVEITIDEIAGGDTIIWVCDTVTGEYIEAFILPQEIEVLIRRESKIDMLFGNARAPTAREIYFFVKDYYLDFDEIYDSMLYADCK